jgi:hypothetical protein
MVKNATNPTINIIITANSRFASLAQAMPTASLLARHKPLANGLETRSVATTLDTHTETIASD